jgi:photosystem II stability/assembly factor-like uncharacterized protein
MLSITKSSFSFKPIILIIIFLLLPLSNLSAQWEIINEGFKGWTNTIDFVNENVGWIAGSSGTLLKTTNGGENWNPLAIDESWNMNQIDFLNESVGWAIGSKYVEPNWINLIWKTSNGGTSWVQQFSSTDFGFNSVHIIDATKVFAVGGNKIYKTTNGGTNWIDVSPNLPERNYNSIWFMDTQTGVVVGNYYNGIADRGIILKTTNGGTNWIETIAVEFRNIYDLQFSDNTSGYFRANNDSINFLCKTEDMFSSWVIKAQSRYGITSFQCIDDNTVYAIIADSINANNIFKSTDGGINWQHIQTFDISNFWIGKIYFSNPTNSFILGGISVGSILFKSSDSSYHWTIKKFSYPLKEFCFMHENNGFIVGGFIRCRAHGCWSEGRIFSTDDGGKTWDLRYGSGSFLRSSVSQNNLIAFTAGGPEITKSYDGGYSWSAIYQNNPDSMGYTFGGNDICLIDEENCIVVGSYGDSTHFGTGILGTNNGGEDWELVWTDTTAGALYSIFHNGNNTWSVGESGLIVKFTSQTGWVKQTSVTDLPLNKVFFSDENHSWIAGGYQNDNDFQKILLRTTNGGINWTTIPNIPYLFRDISFVDNSLGWAIGYNQNGEGGMLRTTDGGNSWVLINGDLPAKLNALYIKDNYGWAVGENGLILGTTDAGAVWVEDECDNSLPTEFVLEQNYPNPFNPSTVIGYQLQVISKVTLKIYDVLGREVATLVNEEQPAGNYEVEFHLASSIKHPASGVYFYQLEAVNSSTDLDQVYIETKKMLLLK